MLDFPVFEHPIIQAPMAGGPSTPALTAAVTAAGGFGFLAAGYKSAAGVLEDMRTLRGLSAEPFGLNLFVPQDAAIDGGALSQYQAELAADAARYGASLGAARNDDDDWQAKLELAIAQRVAVVSFTFGCPAAGVFERLHAHGIACWVTITDLAEARAAEQAGADVLVVQGVEAGGHRGSFLDRDGAGELGVLALTRLCAHQLSLPLVAAGGIADGESVASVLAAGARAAQVGTGFMLCPEAGTSAPHRSALGGTAETALTRAFTGRKARGIVNRFMREHAHAPSAYPQLHHVTAPLRAAARAAGDPELINLWAGQAYALAAARPAAELVREWSGDARRALQRALTQLAPG